MNRGRVGEERGSKEMDRYPLTEMDRCPLTGSAYVGGQMASVYLSSICCSPICALHLVGRLFLQLVTMVVESDIIKNNAHLMYPYHSISCL
jgi:hypothetical protein